MPGRGGRSDAGFTLIELAVVLAILAVLVGMTVPFLVGRTRGGALPAAADEIRTVLRAARSAAIAEGRPVAFRSDPAGGYWLDRQHYRLASASPGAPLRVAIAGGAGIAFYPSGGSSGGRVRIETAADWREIDVDAVTGRAVLRR